MHMTYIMICLSLYIYIYVYCMYLCVCVYIYIYIYMGAPHVFTIGLPAEGALPGSFGGILLEDIR